MRIRWVSSCVLVAAAAIVPGCGARTELPSADLCSKQGDTRSCSDDCGTGVQRCEDGAWAACEVPVAKRDCSDDCGTGTQSCVQGTWGTCEVGLVQRDCSSVCGDGHETCRGGKWSSCDAPLPKPPRLMATVRDFSPTTHPDFEASYPAGLDKGIVLPQLGPDDKPVYAGMPRTRTTTGALYFDKWYRDDPVNRSAPLELPWQPDSSQPGLFVNDNHAFFPIDGQLLGNEGRTHNFHFTLEAHSSFEYRGGETFSFSGDDDMWVFVARQLAIDLGGLHQSLSASIALDEIAPSFGLSRGNVYPLDFFFAERHTSQSNFTLRTTLADPGSCD